MSTTNITYKGVNLAVCPYGPDWSFQPELVLRYKTQVFPALDDTEERIIQYPRPLLNLVYTTLGLDQFESTEIREFRYNLTERPVVMPVWVDYVTVDGDIAAGSNVAIPHTTLTNSYFSIYRPYAVIYRDHRYFELVEVTEYTPQQMTVDNIANTYQQGDQIFPAAVGYCDVSVSKAITGLNASHEVLFREEYFC